MRIFQIRGKPLMAFLCIQFLLVIEFEYVVARRRPRKERDSRLVIAGKSLRREKDIRLANPAKSRQESYQKSKYEIRGRRRRSRSTSKGKYARKKSIEHLPKTLESLRRLGTDLNNLGNELMGFHFPSYLRVLMYVFSLIL